MESFEDEDVNKKTQDRIYHLARTLPSERAYFPYPANGAPCFSTSVFLGIMTSPPSR